MSRLFAALTGIWMAAASVVMAGDNPVVVELYTSQGCSSCPPADEILHKLAKRDDVIPLALHVDYWDYIGWKDSFADPAYTKRQHAYARALGERSVYTPQMIIAGSDHVIGAKAMDVTDKIRIYGAQPTGVSVQMVRSGDNVIIKGTAQSRQKMVVHLVRYSPSNRVAIRRGENAGRTLDYTNVVTEWKTVAKWDGRDALSLTQKASGSEPVVVIIQREGLGPVMAAAQLK